MVSKDMNIKNLECLKLLSIKFLALAVCSTLKTIPKYFLDIPTKVFFQQSYEMNVFPLVPPNSHFNNGDNWGRKSRLSVRKDESGIAEIETVIPRLILYSDVSIEKIF